MIVSSNRLDNSLHKKISYTILKVMNKILKEMSAIKKYQMLKKSDEKYLIVGSDKLQRNDSV